MISRRVPKLLIAYSSAKQPAGVQEAALLSLQRLSSPTLLSAVKSALALPSWSRCAVFLGPIVFMVIDWSSDLLKFAYASSV